MNMFPFDLRSDYASRLFTDLIQRNRTALDEEYGEHCYVGEDCARRESEAGRGVYVGHGTLKCIIWSGVDAEVMSERDVAFTFWHNDKSARVVATYTEGELDRFIDRRKAEIVTSVRLQREREAEELRIQKAEEAIYKELFGS